MKNLERDIFQDTSEITEISSSSSDFFQDDEDDDETVFISETPWYLQHPGACWDHAKVNGPEIRASVRPTLNRYSPMDWLKKTVTSPCISCVNGFKKNPSRWLLGNVSQLKTEFFNGLTVSLAQVPEAVGFSIVAGVAPIMGLYSAMLLGFFAAFLGGQPGMISGAAGSMAVLYPPLVFGECDDKDATVACDEGQELLMMASILCGLFEILVGAITFGRFSQFLGAPVAIGFANGLAIIIGLAQRSAFEDDNGDVVQGSALVYFLLLMFFTMAVTLLLPYVSRLLPSFVVVPSAFVALVATTVLSLALPFDTRRVGDVGDGLEGRFPLPDFGLIGRMFSRFDEIALDSFIYALVGIIESLLTLEMVGHIISKEGRPNQECVAQGVGNVVTGLCGGMAGNAMLGQSVINVSGGARWRLSGMIAGLSLLVIVTSASPLVDLVPLAALSGVMLVVCLKTFQWSSIKTIALRRIPLIDSLTIIVVAVLTVLTNLAIAVAVGVLLQLVAFAWYSRSRLLCARKVQRAHPYAARTRAKALKVYHLHGSLYFAAGARFVRFFDPQHDPDDVMLDLRHCRLMDSSALKSIDVVAHMYQRAHKRFHIKNATKRSDQMLVQAGPLIQHVHNDRPPAHGDATSLSVAYLPRHHPVRVSCLGCSRYVRVGSPYLRYDYYFSAWRIWTADCFHPRCAPFGRFVPQERHGARALLEDAENYLRAFWLRRWPERAVLTRMPLASHKALRAQFLHGFEDLRLRDQLYIVRLLRFVVNEHGQRRFRKWRRPRLILRYTPRPVHHLLTIVQEKELKEKVLRYFENAMSVEDEDFEVAEEEGEEEQADEEDEREKEDEKEEEKEEELSNEGERRILEESSTLFDSSSDEDETSS